MGSVSAESFPRSDPQLFFDYIGSELGLKERIITASSCVTIPGFNNQHIAEWAHKLCLSQIEEAKKYLDKVDTIFSSDKLELAYAKPKV